MKISVFESWGQRGNSSQNAVFHGKRHDNKILKVHCRENFVVIAQAPRHIGHLLKKGNGNEGKATSVWQERARTCVTQMTHMPSLKPLRLLCRNLGSLHHLCATCLSRRKKKVPPPCFGPPPPPRFESARTQATLSTRHPSHDLILLRQ